jgi:hypothetical protein
MIYIKLPTYIKKLINEIASLCIPDVTILVPIPIIKQTIASRIFVEFCIKLIKNLIDQQVVQVKGNISAIWLVT